MGEGYIMSTQYVPGVGISGLGVPGQGGNKGFGRLGSGVRRVSTSKLLHNLKPVPCPRWDSEHLLRSQGGHLGLHDAKIQLLC